MDDHQTTLDTATADAIEVVEQVVSPGVARIRKGLAKEGADIDVNVDAHGRVVTVTLIRNRIVCEGCILPADLVKTLLSQALGTDDRTRAHRYRIETENWAL